MTPRTPAEPAIRPSPRTLLRRVLVSFIPLALLAAACSSPTASANADATESAESGSTADPVAASGTSVDSILAGGEDLAGRKILFEVYAEPSNSFFVPVVNGAEAAAALLGIDLQVQYSNGDDATLTNHIETAVAGGIDGIVTSIPNESLNDVACQVREAGIPLIAFNVNGATGDGADCVMAFVGQSFVEAGRTIGSRLVEDGRLGAGDQVVCPVEYPEASYAAERYQGVQEALQEVGASCELLGVGADLGPAQDTLIQYLLGHPETDAVAGLGQSATTVAPVAIEEAGLDIPVAGFDLAEPILDGIDAGTIIAAVDQQPYSQGFYGVMQTALYIKYGLFPSSMNTGGKGLVDADNAATVRALVPEIR